MRKARCAKCRRLFRKLDLLDWLDEADSLSPKFCPKCYDYILEHYQEGDDIEGNLDFDD